MSARFVIVHDDVSFARSLSAALTKAGYETQTIHDLAFRMPPPRSSDRLEVTILRSREGQQGLRIRVTALPLGEGYAGPLGSFLAEPTSVENAMIALKRFCSLFS